MAHPSLCSVCCAPAQGQAPSLARCKYLQHSPVPLCNGCSALAKVQQRQPDALPAVRQSSQLMPGAACCCSGTQHCSAAPGHSLSRGCAGPLQPLIRCLPGGPCHTVLQGGDIIRQLRAETGSRIKIEEAVDRCDERIVAISAPERWAALTECATACGVAEDVRTLKPKRWHASCMLCCPKSRAGPDWCDGNTCFRLTNIIGPAGASALLSMHLCSGPGVSVAPPLTLCQASLQPHPERSTTRLLSHARYPPVYRPGHHSAAHCS